MKALILLLLIGSSSSIVAEIPLQFDAMGEFIPPDMILQARGLGSYEKGFLNDSMVNFKRSAKFGNDRSKYLTALLYFQNKDWATGYAWLQLVKVPIENRNSLLKKVESMLSLQELQSADTILQSLKNEYNDDTSFKRRNRWERSISITGTRIKGIGATPIRSIAMSFGDNTAPLQIYQVKRQVSSYVEEYTPRGVVTLGVIKEIEEKKGNKK